MLYACFGDVCLLKVEAIFGGRDELKPVVVENQQEVTVGEILMVPVTKSGR